VRQFFTLPTALFVTNPPPGGYHAAQPPGAPNVTMVVVECWDSHAAQDAWEALPGVTEHYLENWWQVAPPGVIAAVTPWGATTGMTLRQVFALIRQNWPAWRL